MSGAAGLDRSTRHSWSSWLAGGGGLVVVAGVALLVTSYAKPAPHPPAAHGTLPTVALQEPSGTVAHLPAQFQWGAVEGAASYLVTVLDGDSNLVVLRKPTSRAALAPSARELSPFRPGKYRWTVEARKQDGKTLALGEGIFELSNDIEAGAVAETVASTGS
jgi:hypothetical protein